MLKCTKITTLLLILITISPTLCLARFSVPGYVYSASQLSSAQKTAKRNHKAITFVYANQNTDCGLARAAALDTFSGLKNHTVIVFAEKKDWSYLPPVVQRSLNSTSSGQYIPKTVVVTSTLDTVICIIPYKEKKERRAMIRQVQGILSKY